LEQPSQVTLLTDSRYVSQGIAHGLTEWRSNDWCWERFGELTPVKNRDLWQRVDRALRFHRVDCRTWRFDAPHVPAGPFSPPVKPQEEPQEPQPRAARTSQPQTKVATFAHQSRSGAKPAENLEETNRRTRPRGSLLAACKSWLNRSAETVRGLQAKVSLEPQ